MKKNSKARYIANITAGALLVPESKKIADLMLRNVSKEEWKNKIEEENILQRLSLSSSKRIAAFIKSRLQLMTPELWQMIRDGDTKLSTQANFAAAVKHCKLLGDYLDLIIREQFKKMEDTLPLPLWDNFIVMCENSDPYMEKFPTSTAQKIRSNIHKILVEAEYLSDPYQRKLQKVEILPEIIEYLKKNNESYVLRCITI
jgi:hypothetical protein